MLRFLSCFLGICFILWFRVAVADPVPFDLAGPKLLVDVTRTGKTLPIFAVPNLQAGDQLAIRVEFSKAQTAHYLLVAAFLRGATNPPPESWFYSSETWNPKQSAGLHITVPGEAQQLLLFLAPETSGDMRAIIGAVRGRPGAFVRASQDLNQATLDRARLRAYLTAIRRISIGSAEQLKDASPLLARSLGLKLNADCLDKIPELQASCLMQGQESLILSDGHSTSLVASLTSGNSVSLIADLSATPKAGAGYYSPYIASVVDIARILDTFHTAQYQYIPALGTQQGNELSLELNTPPSFQNPKSVLVVALPAIQAPQMPPLRPVDPKSVYCAEKNDLVLPVEGAPLVFAMGYAHDMVLRLQRKDGKSVSLPLTPDAEKGGLVAATSGLAPADFGDSLDGSLHGFWGFEPYDGPAFHLENAYPRHWQLDSNEFDQLVSGHDATLHLEAESAACVNSVVIETSTGQSLKADWKSLAPNRIEITAPLKKLKPGPFNLLIRQYGSKDSDAVPLRVFAPAGRLDAFVFHVGDTTAVLKGTQLEDVKAVVLKNAVFHPVPSPADGEAMTLSLVDPKTATDLKAGDSLTADVSLQDGRKLQLETTVAAPRPAVDLLAKSAAAPPTTDQVQFKLTDESEVPRGALFTFSVQARIPDMFTGAEKIEVATEQGATLVTLSQSNGLTMEDPRILIASIDSAKSFPPSAAGPLRFRIVKDGIAGNWQPLATLVRLPSLHQFTCVGQTPKSCTLSGNQIFLMDAIASDSQFSNVIQIPKGFPGFALSVPEPVNGHFYVKLHDAPSIVNEIELPEEVPAAPPIPTPAQEQTNPAPPTTATKPSDQTTGSVNTPGAAAAPAAPQPSAPVDKKAPPDSQVPQPPPTPIPGKTSQPDSGNQAESPH